MLRPPRPRRSARAVSARARGRALRYRASSAHTVTRTLESTASPRLLPDTLADAARERLRRELAHTDVPPRAMSVIASAIRGEDVSHEE